MNAKSARVLLIGGTSEAREIARALGDAGLDVLVSTGTSYGAELVSSEAASRAGALDAAGMAELAKDRACIVDASHPFAVAASESAREAAAIAGVPYLRFERSDGAIGDDAQRCATAQEAAAAAVEAAGPGGTILLTVGSRTLEPYVTACREARVRCVARVLPTTESLDACEAAGLSAGDVIAMQGPTSADLDEAILRHLGVTVLVTKDSGSAGGVPEKLEAARRAGAAAIVVARPADVAVDALRTVDELVASVLALPGVESEPRAPREPGLIHVYTGQGKGKTTAGVGLAVRAVGAGLRVAFVQFVKGGRESSELASLRRLGVEVTRPATRSSGLMHGAPNAHDTEAASIALAAAREALSGGFDLVVLDEACVATRSGLVDPATLVAVLGARAPYVEVALTGRGCPDLLLDIADYVTVLHEERHPFSRGIHARRGIEY